MKKRILGKGGPPVSVLGVGGMSFAGIYGNATVEESHAILDAALDAGVTHIDTANVYGMGRSEEIIGSYLARRKGETPFVLATKAGISRDPETGRNFDNSPAHIGAELDRSLARLGVERIDLFYLHRLDPDVPVEEVVGTYMRLVQAGKIGHIGLSEVAPTTIARATGIHPIAAVQSEYSLQTRSPELGLVQACERLGISLVAFSPVGRGLLTDAPPVPEAIGASAFMKSNPRFRSGNLERNLIASQPLRDLAAEAGCSTAALAIAWVLAQSPSTLVIPGTRNRGHFAELVEGAKLELGADLKAEIERRLPVGWCHGDRYSTRQWLGPQKYC
ncbi:MAG: aldo/keto reductase [Rhodobacteraceae bacterium]|nr:aldo/keto reductase [Paracoccaceae bacterium]